MPSICLNMIVKNEKAVIERCLNSLKHFIDYWVIVDTGSTDGTQERIQKTLSQIPGELHERAWVNFGHNRNEALELAKNKGSYLLFLDADETLYFAPDFVKPVLDKDCYYAYVQTLSNMGQRILLINNEIEWEWEGVIHERIVRPYVRSLSVLTNMAIVASAQDGARAQDPKKYHKDAALLEEALQKEPENTRYLFYLAQSYVNAKEYVLALENYQKRSLAGGLEYEVFWSLYSVGVLQKMLNYPQETSLKSFQAAHRFFPGRAEPIYQLAKLYLESRNPLRAYTLSKSALGFTLPVDVGYIEYSIYEFGQLLLFADSALALEKYEEAKNTYNQLLAKALPSDVKEQITRSLLFMQTQKGAFHD